MPKLQKRKKTQKGGYFITVPLELVEIMKWEEGDTLIFSKIDNKNLNLEKP